MPFADPPPKMDPTPIADVDAAVERLFAQKDAFAKLSLEDRVKLLDACVAGIAAHAETWGATGARIKGIAPDAVLAGEEWVAGIVPAIRNARLLANALRQGGKPKAPMRRHADGQEVARVFPASVMDRVMLGGVTADVWIEKGKPATQGAIYDGAAREGRVCLVLGGGNVSSIPAMDVLYKLFAENEVVLLKMNPVNEAIGPVLAAAFAPLVEKDYLAIVYGGADVGAHAAKHPKVGSLHVTGSDRTYDAIVWGGDKAKKSRANDKPFTAELGCVTPVLVVPGPWSRGDIRFQARHVAAMVTQNASFNCNAAKVIVTARGWLQGATFLEALHDELRRIPARKAYYAGAHDRYRRFLEAYPRAVVLGETALGAPEEVVPWTAITDVPPDAGGYALTNEAFCGVYAEVTLDVGNAPGGADPEKFLEAAVTFANERCWGTLSCALLVHPATEENHADALARAIANLHYGGIGINAWPGIIYGLAAPTWGAYPGHTPEDIQSGTGVVHNAFLFNHPEKSVVRAPFRMTPTPPWFSDHRTLLELGRRLVAFEAKPSWGRLFRVARAALRG
jgi:acyl-CoA reductase-like NAD-dependent aldehyde dehydrogenase